MNPYWMKTPEGANRPDGNYCCRCHRCSCPFLGYKRDPLCQLCAKDVEPISIDEARALIDKAVAEGRLPSLAQLIEMYKDCPDNGPICGKVDKQ